MDSNQSRGSSVLNSLDLNIQDNVVNKLGSLSLSTPTKNVTTSNDSKKKFGDDNQENKSPQNAEGFIFKKPLPKENMAKEDTNLNVLIDELNHLQLGGTPVPEKRFNLGKWSTPLKTRKPDPRKENDTSQSSSSNRDETTTETPLGSEEKEHSIVESDDACSEYYDCSGEENNVDVMSDPLNTTVSSFHSVHDKNKHEISESFDTDATFIHHPEPVSEEKIAEMNRTQDLNGTFILEKFLEANTSPWIGDQDIRLEISVDDVSYRERTFIATMDESVGNEDSENRSNRSEHDMEIQPDQTQADENLSFCSVRTDSSEDVDTAASTIGSSENLLDDIKEMDQLSDQNTDKFDNENTTSVEIDDNKYPNAKSQLENTSKTSLQDFTSLLKTSSDIEQNVNDKPENIRAQENVFKFTFDPIPQEYSFPKTSFEITQSESYVPDMFCQLLKIDTALPKTQTTSERYPSPIQRVTDTFTTESPENLFTFATSQFTVSNSNPDEIISNTRASREAEIIDSSEPIVDEIESKANENQLVNQTVQIIDPKDLNCSVKEDLNCNKEASCVDENVNVSNETPSELSDSLDASTSSRRDLQVPEECDEIVQSEETRLIEENGNINDLLIPSESDHMSDLNTSLQNNDIQVSAESNETFRLEVSCVVNENEPTISDQLGPETNDSSQLDISSEKISTESNETFRLEVSCVVNENEPTIDGQLGPETNDSSQLDCSSENHDLGVSIESENTFQPDTTRVIDEIEHTNDGHLVSESENPSSSNSSPQKDELAVSFEPNETYQLETTRVLDKSECINGSQSYSEINNSSRLDTSPEKYSPRVSIESNETFQLETTRVIDENECNRNGQTYSEANNSFQFNLSQGKVSPRVSIEPNETFQLETTRVIDENECNKSSQTNSVTNTSFQFNVSQEKVNPRVSIEPNETFQLETTRVIDENECNKSSQTNSETNTSFQFNVSQGKVSPRVSIEPNETFQLETTRIIDDNEPTRDTNILPQFIDPSNVEVSPQKDILQVPTESNESRLNGITEDYDDMAMEVDEEIVNSEVIDTQPDVFETSAMSICDVSINHELQPTENTSPGSCSDLKCIRDSLSHLLTPDRIANVNSGNTTPLNSSTEMDETVPIDTTEMVTVDTEETQQAMKPPRYVNRMFSQLTVIAEANEGEVRDEVGKDVGIISETNIADQVTAEIEEQKVTNDLEMKRIIEGSNSTLEETTPIDGNDFVEIDTEDEPKLNPSNAEIVVDVISETKKSENLSEPMVENLNDTNSEAQKTETQLQSNLNETIVLNDDTTANTSERVEFKQNETEVSDGDSEQSSDSNLNVTVTFDNHSIKENEPTSTVPIEEDSEKPTLNSTTILESKEANETFAEIKNPDTLSLEQTQTIEASPETPVVTRELNKTDGLFKTPNYPKLPSTLSDSSFNADYCAGTPSTKRPGNSLISPKSSFYKNRSLCSPFCTPNERKIGGIQETPKASGDVPASLLDMSLGYFEQFTATAQPQNTGYGGVSRNDILNRTRDVDEEPEPEETKLLIIEEPTRMVNAKTQTHDNELNEVKIENEQLKNEVNELKRKINEVLELAKILHANETSLKEACKQHEDNNRILNNRYELMKELSNELIAKRNKELDEAEAEIKSLKNKLAERMKKS